MQIFESRMILFSFKYFCIKGLLHYKRGKLKIVEMFKIMSLRHDTALGEQYYPLNYYFGLFIARGPATACKYNAVTIYKRHPLNKGNVRKKHSDFELALTLNCGRTVLWTFENCFILTKTMRQNDDQQKKFWKTLDSLSVRQVYHYSYLTLPHPLYLLFPILTHPLYILILFTVWFHILHDSLYCLIPYTVFFLFLLRLNLNPIEILHTIKHVQKHNKIKFIIQVGQ